MMVGGFDGELINEGFLGDDLVYLIVENFVNLMCLDFVYMFYIFEGVDGECNLFWFNDMMLYYNCGESFWFGESELYGDFVGLDDFNIEYFIVVCGMIDIYKLWIIDFCIDGYCIDIVKYVCLEFWVEFMLEIMVYVCVEGIEYFYVFGEVYEYDLG